MHIRIGDKLAHSEGESLLDRGSVTAHEADPLFKRDVLAGGHWIAFGKIVKDTAPGFVAAFRESHFFRIVPLYCDFHIAYYDEMATHFGSFINKLYLVRQPQLLHVKTFLNACLLTVPN